jgi:hypothetical protein
LIHFSRWSDENVLFSKLLEVCDIVSVGINAAGDCSAVCRGTSYSNPALHNIPIVKCYNPKLRGRVNSDDKMVEFTKAWGLMQRSFRTNFAVYDPTVSVETVLAEWSKLSDEQVQEDILNARVKARKSKGDTRSNFIAQNHVDLLKIRKLRSEGSELMMIQAADPCIFPIRRFVPPVSQLKAWFRDISDGGRYKEFCIRAYIRDPETRESKHLTHALVLHGPPKYAKTPLAKSIATQLAMMHQSKMAHEPLCIIVGTADSLPRGGDRRMKSGVPIVLDDLRPNEQRINRPPHSIEDMKSLGDVEIGGDMSGRFKDVHFEPNMPRLFTSNVDTPREFFHAFPTDLKTLTNEAVMRLPYDVLALVKRYAFCLAPQRVIPDADRNADHESRNGSLDQVAEEMFGGANALP